MIVFKDEKWIEAIRVRPDQSTTKERGSYPDWLIEFATGQTPGEMIAALRLAATRLHQRECLRVVRKYRRVLKREPFARQLEMEFPKLKSK